MEQKLLVMGKKVWSLIRAMFFMLKKGITSIKFFADLNMVIKRGKIAGKAFHNLLFHHHHNWASATFHSHHPHHLPSGEHEFSCSDTPPNTLSLFSTHKKRQNKNRSLPVPHAPPSVDENIDGIYLNPELLKALDMLTSVAGSLAIMGAGKSPMVKQLRITDSPQGRLKMI